MLSKLFKTKIYVQFIDAKNNQVFARSKLPMEHLPKSFNVDTIIHIEDVAWQMVSATPNNFDEIKKTKCLQITLQKIEEVNLNKIFYTIPTLSSDAVHLDGMHFIKDSAISKEDSIFIHPDDWRQIEFILKNQIEEAHKEFESINTIYESHEKSGALKVFKRLHRRSLINKPLHSLNLTTEILSTFFNPEFQKYIALPEPENIIENSFFYKLSDSIALYGITQNHGLVECMGLLLRNAPEGKIISQIITFCEKYNLLTVDWINRKIIIGKL